MEETVFSQILSISLRTVENAKVEKLRDFSKGIVDNVLKRKGVFLVYGLRGVGKTTVLAEVYHRIKNAVYINGDVLIKYGVDLLDFLHHAAYSGYTTFLIDEIHSIPSWEKDVKIFYDETGYKIVLSGSSATALRTKGSELSRRATLFELRPLSFREYLMFKTGKSFPILSLRDIVDKEKRLKMLKMIAPYVGHFRRYVEREALPVSFFEGRHDAYWNIVERVVRFDLQTLRDIDINYVNTAFKVIRFVATSSPGEVSYSKMANSIGRSVKIVMEVVHYLSLSGLFYIVPPAGLGHRAVRSEDKVLLPLSFRNMLCESYGLPASTGGIREDFFIQHVKDAKYLKTGIKRKTPDYVIGDLTFEVGGPTKGWAQVKRMKNSYLVKESLSLGDKEIPLYLFGFLY